MAIDHSQQMLDEEICESYEHIYTCTDSIVLLMKRVAIRVVEVTQMGYESLK
jgi:hypothetical protein